MDQLWQQALAADQPQAADLTPGSPAWDIYQQRKAAIEQTLREQGMGGAIPAWVDEIAKKQALQDAGAKGGKDGGAPYCPPDITINLGMGMPKSAEAR